MKLVRGSEVQDFLRCRLRWKYAWVDGYRAQRQNEKLFIGTLVHRFLEALYSGCNADGARKEMYDLFQASDDMSDGAVEAYNLAVKMTDHYVKYWQDDFEVIATELQFAIPLSDEIVYTGTVDLVFKNAEGKLYFMDHKTTASIDKYEKNSDMDRQISRYWWALQQLAKGEGYVATDHNEDKGPNWVHITHPLLKPTLDALKEPAGFVYNILLKDVPEPPAVLKNGSLSKAKGQNTTYELYLKALEELGMENYPEYEDILNHLKENGKQYFKRVEVIRNQKEIDAAIREFYWTASELKNVADLVQMPTDFDHESYESITYRNITSDCSWDCQFKDVCKAGLDGSDVQYLLNVGFKKEEQQQWTSLNS